MNWLIVASSAQAAQLDCLNALLRTYNAHIDVFLPDTQDVPRTVWERLPDIDYCVFICDVSFWEIPPVAYMFGYLTGKEIPVFGVGAGTACVPGDIPFLSCVYRRFETLPLLTDMLTGTLPEYVRKENQKKSRKKLLEQGIPFNPDSFAFHVASGDEKECTLFLDAGIDVNSRDAAGTPMLCTAVRYNRKNLVQTFLKQGADVNAVSKDRGYSPVMDAVWKSNADIVRLLLSKGADIGGVSRDGQPVLVLAVGTGNEEICRMLVEHGADPDACDSMGMSANAYAKLFKKDALVALFAQAGARKAAHGAGA